MVKQLARTFVLLALLLHGMAWAAVTLDITPDPALANQSVELSFRVTGGVDADPDFSALEKSFEILARNRQTTMSWINGTSERSTTWVVNCMPRGTGRISIPAISFGSQASTARELEIADGPTPTQGVSDDADILLKVSAAPQSPYVQQQVVYTIKLLHRVELSNPRFSQLSTNSDAVVKPLTNGRQFSEEINGRSYEGYEIKYVVFAQKSGKLRIAPLTLTTEVAVSRRSVFDPFARTLNSKRIESEALELDVKPVPASFPPGATWLPAKRLSLHEEWEPDVKSAEVGAPLTRTLFLWTDGLLSGQLPTIKLTAPDGIKLYPDQAQSNDQDTANGYTAVAQRKFAIVASQAGEAHFEEVVLPWWNIETDQLEIARLPARALSVKAAPGSALRPFMPAPNVAAASPAPAGAGPAASEEGPWRVLAVLLGTAWLVTLVLWWWSKRGLSPPGGLARAATADIKTPPHGARAARDLKGACAGDDARGARDALLAWARSQRSGSAELRSLRDLAQQVGAELSVEITALERHLYGADGSDGGAWYGQSLWQAFQRQPQTIAAKNTPPPPLPRLFKLGAG